MKPATLLTALAVLLALSAGPALGWELRPGEKVEGRMAGAGSVQDFEIGLVAGETFRMRLMARGAGRHAPAVVATDPSGAVVDAASGRRRLALAITAKVTGVHRVRLTANSQTSAEYQMRTRGAKSMKYAEKGGEMTFGASAGARVTLRMKGAAGNVLSLQGPGGEDIALVRRGQAARARSLPSTGEYRVEWEPADNVLRAKVRAAGARGIQRVEAREPAPPPPQPAPAPAPTPAPDPAPVPPGGDDGGSQDDGNDDGGDTGDVPPPGPALDHSYLAAAMLRPAEEADLDRALRNLAGYERDRADLVLGLLEDQLRDGAATRLLQTLVDEGRAHEPLGAHGLQQAAQAIRAERRLRRAESRLALLDIEVGGTSVAGSQAYDAARIEARAIVEIQQAALDGLLGGTGWMTVAPGDADANFLELPEAPAHAGAQAGAAALDQAAIQGRLMARARGSDAAAIDLAQALYATALDMLARNPDGVSNPAALEQAIRIALGELQALAAGLPDEGNPAPDAGARKYLRAVIRADGVGDQLQVEFEAQGDAGMLARQRPEGLDMRTAIREQMHLAASWKIGENEGNAIVLASASHDGRLQAIQIEAAAEGVDDQAVVQFQAEVQDGFVVHASQQALVIQTTEPRQSADIRVTWTEGDLSGGFDLFLEVVDEPAAVNEVAGHAMDEEGRPLAGVEAMLREQPEGEKIALSTGGRLLLVRTDEGGRFRLAHVPDGRYLLVLRAEGRREASAEVVIAAEAGEEGIVLDVGEIALR